MRFLLFEQSNEIQGETFKLAVFSQKIWHLNLESVKYKNWKFSWKDLWTISVNHVSFCHHCLLWFYRCDRLLLLISLLQIAQPVEDGFGSRLGKTQWSFIHEKELWTNPQCVISCHSATFGRNLCSLFHSRGFSSTCWGYKPLYLSYVEHQPCFKVPFGGTICYNTRLNVCVSQRFTDSTRRDDCLWF